MDSYLRSEFMLPIYKLNGRVVVLMSRLESRVVENGVGLAYFRGLRT